MAGKMETLILKAKRIPFGIIAGSCLIAVFFSVLSLIVVYAVMSGVAHQTMDTVSFLEEWWQMLIFIAGILAAVIAVASFAMFLIKKKYVGRDAKDGDGYGR